VRVFSLFAVGALFALLAWLWFARRYALALCCVLIVPLVSRVLSTLYIDLAGPVYSVQMFRDLGPGGSAGMLVLADLCFILPLFFVFNRSVAAALLPRDEFTLERTSRWGARKRDVAVVLFGAFVAALYVDMFRKGVIPLFAGLERYDYTAQYGGVFHGILADYGMIVAFALGAFFAVPWLRAPAPDYRFLTLLLGLFAYLFLAGNRASAFYTQGTAFLMPTGLVMLQRHELRKDAGARASPPRRRWLVTAINTAAVIGCLSVVGYAIYYSYVFTRAFGTDLVWQALHQRIAVQPGEMWVATYQRVFLHDGARPDEAFDKIFVHPIVDPGRNSSIPYLMVAEIGSQAHDMLDLGLNWGGGFPEIAFELLGVGGGFLLVFAMGGALAATLYGVFWLVARERYVSALLLFYITFALLIFAFGGMLNFLVNWKFWVKVAGALAWIGAESVALARRRAGASSVPESTRLELEPGT
jgi:hypothetical protein